MKMFTMMLAAVFTLSSTAMAAPAVYVRSNGQFVANGNEYKRGFWIPAVEDADEVFRSNPEAYREYQDHITDARWFGILNWSAIGAFAAYALISSSADRYNGTAGFLIFFVPWFSGLVAATQSNRHLIKAINIMNGVPATEAALDGTPRFEARATGQAGVQLPLLSWEF
jgi:hypothetical protein